MSTFKVGDKVHRKIDGGGAAKPAEVLAVSGAWVWVKYPGCVPETIRTEYLVLALTFKLGDRVASSDVPNPIAVGQVVGVDGALVWVRWPNGSRGVVAADRLALVSEGWE